MKRNIIIAFIAIVALSFSACKERGLDTNQYGDKVSLNAFGPCPVLRGDTIIVMGAHMDQVSQVLFPIANEDVPGYLAIEKSSFIASGKPAEEFYIKVPENAISSKIALVADKDTIWSSTVVSYVEAVEIKGIKPETPVTAGDIVTIEGEFMWNITSVTFAGGVTIEAADFVKVGRKYVQVTVPIEAVSGKVTLLAGEDEFEAGELEIHNISIKELSATESDFGETITITGEYFQLVKSVDVLGIKEVEFKVNQENTQIQVVIPEDAVPGVITLNSYAGLFVKSDTINLPMIEFESVGPKLEDLKVGDEIVITGQRLDRVKYIELPSGEILENIKYVKQQYELSADGTQISFKVVKDQGDGGVVLVQNANYSVKTTALSMHKDSYDIFYAPAGGWNVGTWDHNMEVGPNNPDIQAIFMKTITKPGKLTINFTLNEDPAGGYWNLKCQWLDWATALGNAPADGFGLSAGDKSVSIQISQADIDFFTTTAVDNPGWVFYGNEVTITSFEFHGDGDPTIIWKDEAIADGWGNQPVFFSDGGAELLNAGMTVGSTVYFTIEKIRPDENYACKITEGHWGPCFVFYSDDEGTTEEFVLWKLEEHNNMLPVQVTQEIYDQLVTVQNWGNAFLLNANNVKCTKVSISNPQ